jgi:hypothetical protein
MKLFRLLPAVVALGLLAGCATLTQNDQALLQQHHVSPALYSRMVHVDPLALSDIIELTQRHLSPDFIIYYLSSTRVAYRLTARDLSNLRNAGVSKQVIDYLLSTPPRYAPAPYYYPPVNYYYGPGYYAPGYYPGYVYPRVIIGGGYYGGYYGGGYRHYGWH